jgi:hypothetical protein
LDTKLRKDLQFDCIKEKIFEGRVKEKRKTGISEMVLEENRYRL